MDQIIYTAVPVLAALFIVLFALPSYVSLVRQQGFGRGLLIIFAVGALMLIALGAAVQFALPFGAFTFADTLGYLILGVVPWTIAFAYTPLILASFWLGSKLTTNRGRILITALVVTLLNAALDPALAFMGLRSWDNGGPFFGVPILNFAGWFVLGLIAALLIQALWQNDDEEPARRGLAFSGFAITWFWGGVNLGLKQWIPAAIGLGAGLFMLVLFINEKRREKNARKKLAKAEQK